MEHSKQSLSITVLINPNSALHLAQKNKYCLVQGSVVTQVGFEAGLPECEAQLCFFLAVWSQVS